MIEDDAAPDLPDGLEQVPIGEGGDPRAEALDASGLVRDLEWRQLETLAGYWQVYRARAEQVVLPEGWRHPFMALVTAGRVRVEKLDSMDTPQTMAVIGEGRIFGEMSLIDREPASASVVAAEDTQLLVLTVPSLQRLEREYPALALVVVTRIARLISQKLRATSGKLVDLL